MAQFKARIRLDGTYSEVVINADYYNNARKLLEAQYGADKVVFLSQMGPSAEEIRAEEEQSRLRNQAEAAARQAGVDRARAEEDARKAELNRNWDRARTSASAPSIQSSSFPVTSDANEALVYGVMVLMLPIAMGAYLLLGWVWYLFVEYVMPVIEWGLVAVIIYMIFNAFFVTDVEESNKETGPAPSLDD